VKKCARSSYFISVISGKNASAGALILRLLLRAFSYPYSLFMRIRNLLYDKNILKSVSARCPVISVGNITLGGTGKTPCVQWLCRKLSDKGNKPVILSRGFGAKKGEINDEYKVLLSNLPSVSHIANPNRVSSAERAVKEFDADCLVLDDGFSHRRLKREIDILLLDSLVPYGYGRLLPAGLLREPIASTRRADVIILTHSDLVDGDYLNDFEDKLKRLFPAKPVLREIHKPVKIREICSLKEYPPDWIKGKNIYAFCGTGNPEAFEKTLKKLGAGVIELKIFSDHYIYKAEDVDQIISDAKSASAEIILTTQKDAVKIKTFKKCDSVYELIISFEVVRGAPELEARILRLFA